MNMWILLNFLQKLPLKETPVIDGVILENFFYRKKREFYDFCTWMFVLYSNFMAENKSLRKKNLNLKNFVKKHKSEAKENAFVFILGNLKTLI